MQAQFENIVQTENGTRNVLQFTHKGAQYEVVAGYDITHDNWPFHVYFVSADGSRDRLGEQPTRFSAATLEAAFEEGKARAAHWHARQFEGGFQKVVDRNLKPY